MSQPGDRPLTYAPPGRGAFRPHVMGRGGMVTAGHSLAAWWGAEILRRGGNAADAGVAAGLVLNVVHNDMATLSGVAPIVYLDGASGRVHTISGVGRWPASTDAERIMADYAAGRLAGIECTVVPAAADAWITALEAFGTMDWRELAAYPLELARKGFAVHHFMSENVQSNIKGYRDWPENARIFLRDGEAPAPGTVIEQPELAELLSRLDASEAEAAAAGLSREARMAAVRDRFYRGDVAREMVAHYRELGALLELDDLADFRVGREEPITVDFRGLDVWGCGPWSQGPVFLQALAILRDHDFSQIEPAGPDFFHLVVEALKLAFADLEAHCGDPEFVDVPMAELLSPEYTAARAALIDQGRAFPGMAPYGDPRRGLAAAGDLPLPGAAGGEPPMQRLRIEPDTSFVSVMDDFGNAFAATPSDSIFVNPIVPGLGVHISRRGAQTRLEPGYPNTVAPRKRPRLTPNPVVITKDGKPYVSMGTPGANCQPQAMLQVLLYMEVYGMSPQQAVEQPRVATYSFPETQFPYTCRPGLVRVEACVPEATRAELARRGHRVEVVADWAGEMGGVCVVKRDPDTGVLWGGADPRRETYTVAF